MTVGVTDDIATTDEESSGATTDSARIAVARIDGETTDAAMTDATDSKPIQRRLVHGMMKLFAICHATSGFSRNRRMLYSYQRLP